MDLFVVNQTTWEAVDAPITNAHSIIWAERFFEDGDVEIKTYAIAKFRDILPPGTLVSIRGSRSVAMIETHNITTDDRGLEFLTIKGKSLTVFTKYRVIGEKRGKKYKASVDSSLGMCVKLLYNSLVNATKYDLTLSTPAEKYYKSVEDAIPNVAVTDSTGEFEAGTNGTMRQRWLSPGYMDDELRRFLKYRPYAIRVVRPPHSAYLITVSNSGAVSRPWTDNIPKLCFDVYRGVDRSHTQTARPQIVFDVGVSDLIKPGYIWSNELLKTETHIVTTNRMEVARPSLAVPSGLSRRVDFLDAGEAEDGYTEAEWRDHIVELAEKDLDRKQVQEALDGEVSADARYKFGVDYNLGDVVSVRGAYGVLGKARVTEFIRAQNEDKSEEGYPTFTYI